MDYSKSAVVVPTVWVDLNYARSHGVLKLSDEVGGICYLSNENLCYIAVVSAKFYLLYNIFACDYTSNFIILSGFQIKILSHILLKVFK